MRRRELVAALTAAALWPLPALAQQKALVIGYLSGVSPGPYAQYLAAFRQGLGEAGYVEGQNVAIEYRWAEGQYDRLPAMAADLVARKVDVIAASGGPRSAPAAKSATSTIPIVFATGGDPVAQGLVKSLARPGGNVTGFTFLVEELMEKRLDLLTELVPHVQGMSVLINPTNPNAVALAERLPAAAKAKGLQLHILKASTATDIDEAFAALGPLKSSTLLAGSDAFFNDRREQIVTLAARYAIPAIYDTTEFAAIGGLMTYGPSIAEAHRQFGAYVGKVLRGAKPADLPVQQPAKFELVINLRTAKALGLTVPQSLLARADEVIE
jgi:putative ABC transport system substrate-binding protein